MRPRSAQIHPSIEGHLLVAAAPGVNLAAERADFVPQFSNDKGVDVFVLRSVEIFRISRFAGDFSKSIDEFAAFLGQSDALLREGAGEGLRTCYVSENQFAIKAQRSRKALE